MNKFSNFSDQEQLENISESSLIEEGGHSNIVKKSIIFIVIALLAFILWSIFTEVDEVAISFGDIQPVENIQIIQHLEGGIISNVLVKNGEEVVADQVLMTLSGEPVKAELQKAQGKEVSLILDAERLRAFIHRIPANKVIWSNKVVNSAYNKIENKSQISSLIKSNIDLLQEQNQEQVHQRKILTEKVAQKKSQLNLLIGSKADAEKQLMLHKREKKMLGTLVPKGYVSQLDYIIVMRKTNEAEAKISRLNVQITEAKSSLQEAKNRLDQLDTTLDKSALENLNQINAQLLETRHTIQRLSDAQKRLTIKAPVTGLIKGLIALRGSVVAPGDPLMEIIPTKGEMMVHSKISTRDIGHVKIGDPVDVKITTYDFARYGGVKGKVIDISASTFTNPEGLPYYLAKISLEKNYVGKNPKRNLIKPGMTVQAEIITGKKSIMEYILKPITRAIDTSFKER